MDHYLPNFDRICFIERSDTVSAKATAVMTERPFAEIPISGEGNVRRAVSIGVVLAILLTVGVVPNVQI